MLECRQEKYQNKNFDVILELSQDFVKDIARIAMKNNFNCRVNDDKTPFMRPDGTLIRLWDLMLIDNEPEYKSIHVEAKDFPSALKWNITGLPKRYIDQKMMLAKGGEDLILLFRQNTEWVEKYASYHKMSKESIFMFLEHKSLAKKLNNGKWYFYPYGNFLSTLMRKEHRLINLESSVKSHLSAYKGEEQYLWKLDSMYNFPMIIKFIIRNKCVPHLGVD